MDEPLVWYEGQDVISTSRRYLSRDERGSIIGVDYGDSNRNPASRIALPHIAITVTQLRSNYGDPITVQLR